MDDPTGVPPVTRRENPYRNPNQSGEYKRKQKEKEEEEKEEEERKGPPSPDGSSTIDVQA